MNKDLITFTISDLIIKYKYERKEEYLKEVKDRIVNCGLDSEYKIFVDDELSLINSDKLIKDRDYSNITKDNIKEKEKELLVGELAMISVINKELDDIIYDIVLRRFANYWNTVHHLDYGMMLDMEVASLYVGEHILIRKYIFNDNSDNEEPYY